MIIQVVKDGVVVDCLVVDARAEISADGKAVAWPDGEYAASTGATLMMQEGAGISWALEGGVLAAPSVPAPAVAVPASVSRRQFFQAAAQDGVITQPDALALFATGTIPANLSTAIATLPAAQQFAAHIAILGDQNFARANPLIIALGAAMGKTPAQVDALFVLAATL